MTFSKATVKQSEHYYCQDFLKKRLNNSLIEEMINTRTHIKVKKTLRNQNDKISQLIVRSHIASYVAWIHINWAPAKKYSSFEERRKRWGKLNLCSKYTSRRQKWGLPRKKERVTLVLFKVYSKCHISALCDKPKTTLLYTSLGISQDSDETYTLPVVQITFFNGARRMAVNYIFDTGSQRSYVSINITYYLKSSKGQIKEVRLPLNTYTSCSTKNFQLVEL